MKLIDKLPSFEHNPVGYEIQGSFDKELDILSNIKAETFDQLFVDTATWGLDFWEDILSIKTNNSLRYEVRRSNIKAKMRGRGTTTSEVIKNICEAYIKNEAKVRQYPNEFLFVLDLIVNKTDYKTLLELDKFVEKIKPCHLEHRFNMILQSKDNSYVASICNSGDHTTIYPWLPSDIELRTDIKVGVNNDISIDNTTIYPREVI
ncbi:putative phage tail protein [Metaclostridioides mangenotii]|uniref:P2-related tail formation protein n=1 Tax=Metaclostridioides mangenotii TaxID=1540 RepID=A0ABS4E912_9FIRM|nr:putative phage tail protein [Clostridioides mangenotii]MBP1854430.1 P2-related tail formation protein [Clostridioides mangenotii]